MGKGQPAYFILISISLALIIVGRQILSRSAKVLVVLLHSHVNHWVTEHSIPLRHLRHLRWESSTVNVTVRSTHVSVDVTAVPFVITGRILESKKYKIRGKKYNMVGSLPL